jgi:hypothetical protein
MADRQKEILNAIKDANQKFKADLELVGSWAEQGFSKHDIDVVTNRGGKEAIDAAKYIAKKTGLLVDVFLSWVYFPRLDRNVWVFPDGKWGYGIDFMVDEVMKESLKVEEVE